MKVVGAIGGEGQGEGEIGNLICAPLTPALSPDGNLKHIGSQLSGERGRKCSAIPDGQRVASAH